MEKITGEEQAFPFEENGKIHASYSTGLTIRQYFAGLAMQLYSSHTSYYSGNPEILAQQSVKLADALIAELNKPVDTKP